MSVSRITERYAKSLLDLSKEQNKTDRVLEDIESFNKMLESRDLELLLKSPIVNAPKKKAIFNALFSDKFDPLTMTFFDVILRKGREQYLPQIAEGFVNQYKSYQGITDVKLTTATEVTPDILEQVEAILKDSDTTGKSVNITTKIDKSIIGGFILEIGDSLFDNSISHKIKEFRKQFA